MTKEKRALEDLRRAGEALCDALYDRKSFGAELDALENRALEALVTWIAVAQKASREKAAAAPSQPPADVQRALDRNNP